MKYVLKNKFYIFIMFLIDLFGYMVFLPLRLLGKNRLPADIKNILIIRLDHIGDVIFSTSILKALREKYPLAHITFLVSEWAKDIIRNNPDIDEIITYSPRWFARCDRKSGLKDAIKLIKRLRVGNYDLGLELRGDFRNIVILFLSNVKYAVGYGITGGGFLLSKELKYDKKSHQVYNNIAVVENLGIQVLDKSPQLYLTDEDKLFADNLLKENRLNDNDLLVGMHITCGYPSKQWRKENFARLIEIIIKELNAKVIIAGSKDDTENIEDTLNLVNDKSHIYNFAGKTNLGQLASLIKKCNIFVSADSGPAHIAGIVGTPLIVIYSGTNDPAQWGPHGKKVVIMKEDVRCSPCEKRICSNHICMDSITVEEVFESIKKLLKEKERAECA